MIGTSSLTASTIEFGKHGMMAQMMPLTYRLRLLPTKGQHARLTSALNHTRDLYNAALEERIDFYRKTKKTATWASQCKGLTELRSDPSWSMYSVAMQRWPLKQVDLAFKAFFARVKSGTEKAGFPRFRGFQWFKTFGFADRDGWRVEDRYLCMKGVGAIRFNTHRALPSKPIACKVKREGKNWIAFLTVMSPRAEEHIGEAIGIDVGVTHLVTLSNGEHIQNARHGARLAGRIRRAARTLARCKRGSRNRQKAKARLASVKLREANARATHLHQVSAHVARRFGTIVVEKLNLKGLVRSAKGTIETPGTNVKAKAGLNRSIHDAAFGRFRELLRYKAAKAGGKLIEVDARYTSQTCSACGSVDAASRRSQSQFVCTGCGHEMNADHNAARNIALRGGVLVPGALSISGLPGMSAESSSDKDRDSTRRPRR